MEQQIEEIDLREYLRVLVRRKWIIVILFVSAVISAAVANSMMTPIYEASTTILIKEDSSGLGAMPFLAGNMEMGRDMLQNYVEQLKSRSIALATAKRLGLDYSIDSPELEQFRQSISVQPMQTADAIKISVQSPDPVEAMHTANTLVEVFIDAERRENQLEARSAKEFIEEQIEVVSKELKQAEEALKEFKETNRIFLPTEEVSAVLERISELDALRAEAAVMAKETQVRLSNVRQQLKDQQQEVISSTTITNNPLVQQYKGRLAQLETELSTALEVYTEQHPKVQALRSDIASVKQQLSSEMERIVSAQTRTVNPVYQGLLEKLVGLEVESVAQKARMEAVDAILNKYTEKLAAFPENELRLARLTRNKLVAEEIYLMLAKRYEEIRITEAMETSSVKVIDSAIVPREPIKPRKKLNMAIAGFLGIFVGIGLAFFLEFMDTSVKNADDVERLLGVPVLAQIPDMGSFGPKRSRRYRR